MRRRISFILIMMLIIFVSCKNNKQEALKDGFIIDGKLTNASGKQILLQQLTAKELITIDSAIVNNDGSFSFTYKPTETSIFLLRKDANNYISLIADKGEHITFESDYDKFQKAYTVKGSQGSELICQLNQHIQKNLCTLDSLGKIWDVAKNDINRVQIKTSIDTTYFRTVREQKAYQTDFINKNSSSFAAMVALYLGLDRTMVINIDKDFNLFEKVSNDLLTKYPKNTQAIELDKRVKQMKMLLVEKKIIEERNSKK